MSVWAAVISETSFSSHPLALNWQVNQNNQETKHGEDTQYNWTQIGLVKKKHTHTFGKKDKDKTGQVEPGLVTLATWSQEMERVYSYNPGAWHGDTAPGLGLFFDAQSLHMAVYMQWIQHTRDNNTTRMRQQVVNVLIYADIYWRWDVPSREKHLVQHFSQQLPASWTLSPPR